MAEDLQDFHDELLELYEEIRTAIDAIPKIKSPSERADKVEYVNGRIARAKVVLSSFKVEMRDMSKAEAEPWQRKAKEHQQKITDFTQNLASAQEKAELMRGKKAPPKEKPVEEMSANEIIDKGASIQKKDLDRLNQVLDVVEQTKEVAARTASELQAQTEQLERINSEMEEVQENLKLAQRHLRAFVRKMATDKIIMVFLVLVILAIIAVIIVSAVKKGNVNGTNFLPNI